MKNRGFTLIELIVASTLALLVLLLGFQLFLPAMRAWTDGHKRSEVSQGLLVTSKWVGDDVLRSAPGSLKLSSEDVLSMKCSLGQTDGQDNKFDQFVVYWVDQGELYRGHQIVPDDQPDPSVALADLSNLEGRRRVASDVTSFEVTLPQSWRVELHLGVDKLGRTGELRTSFSSIYAPFDLEIAEAEAGS